MQHQFFMKLRGRKKQNVSYNYPNKSFDKKISSFTTKIRPNPGNDNQIALKKHRFKIGCGIGSRIRSCRQQKSIYANKNAKSGSIRSETRAKHRNPPKFIAGLLNISRKKIGQRLDRDGEEKSQNDKGSSVNISKILQLLRSSKDIRGQHSLHLEQNLEMKENVNSKILKNGQNKELKIGNKNVFLNKKDGNKVENFLKMQYVRRNRVNIKVSDAQRRLGKGVPSKCVDYWRGKRITEFTENKSNRVQFKVNLKAGNEESRGHKGRERAEISDQEGGRKLVDCVLPPSKKGSKKRNFQIRRKKIRNKRKQMSKSLEKLPKRHTDRVKNRKYKSKNSMFKLEDTDSKPLTENQNLICNKKRITNLNSQIKIQTPKSQPIIPPVCSLLLNKRMGFSYPPKVTHNILKIKKFVEKIETRINFSRFNQSEKTKFEIKQILGSGNYAIVKLMKRRFDGRLFAGKFVNLRMLKSKRFTKSLKVKFLICLVVYVFVSIFDLNWVCL